MNFESALTPKTANLIEKVSQLECIKPYILVGGTALALQIRHRKSEDIDFMKWKTSQNKPEVNWYEIEKELETIGVVKSKDILDINQVLFNVDDVKLSFYAPDKYSPIISTIPFLNNVLLADIISIMAMKMEVLLRRSNFRDYYDIYAILKYGVHFNDAISLAVSYSGHHLKTKNLISMLANGERFFIDTDFPSLDPIYNVTPAEIEKFIIEHLKENNLSIVK